MTITFAPKCLKELQRIKKHNRKLFTKIEKQLVLFELNPEHPSLRLHKLSGVQQECWSISIDMSYRLLFYYSLVESKQIVVFFSFGTHKEVYT